MRDRSNSREKAETVRKRGFGLSRPVLCIALSLTLVIGCIPHDDPITSAKADAIIPVAVGVGAAAATSLGITEAELVLGIMAALGAGIGMQISFNDMYESIDSSTMEMDLTAYQTNFVDWKGLGVNVPNWGDLDTGTQNAYGGWAWHYDEAVWLAYVSKYMGLNTSNGGPNDPNNTPQDNKKWNLIKALGKAGTAVAVAELGLFGAQDFINRMFSLDEASMQIKIWNEAQYNGKAVPFYIFEATTGLDPGYPNNVIAYDSWPYGCLQKITSGNASETYRVMFYYGNTSGNTPNVNIWEDGTQNAWRLYAPDWRQGSWSTRTYDLVNDTWTNTSDNIVAPNLQVYLGSNIVSAGNNTVNEYYYFINPYYVGGYTFRDSNGVVIDPVRTDDYEYGQLSDYPQQQAQNLFNNDPSSYNNYWINLPASSPDKTLTLTNPYYKGEMNPEWQDYIKETNTTDVFPVPDTQPSTDQFPQTPEQPDPEENPDYDSRLRRIAQLAFSQAFPFCLINDIKLLSDKFVEAGSANPDFSVDIPLEDFGIEGVEVLTLDANHPSTGGGLLELGDYTRPLITIVFIGILLGFSIKLFLR